MRQKAEEVEARIEARIEELKEQSPVFDPEIWEQTRQLKEEIRAVYEPDPEITEQRRILYNHNLLQKFYNSDDRYSPGFEQSYYIFKEEGVGDDSLQIAHTLNILEDYKEASLYPSDQLLPTSIRRAPEIR